MSSTNNNNNEYHSLAYKLYTNEITQNEYNQYYKHCNDQCRLQFLKYILEFFDECEKIKYKFHYIKGEWKIDYFYFIIKNYSLTMLQIHEYLKTMLFTYNHFDNFKIYLQLDKLVQKDKLQFKEYLLYLETTKTIYKIKKLEEIIYKGSEYLDYIQYIVYECVHDLRTIYGLLEECNDENCYHIKENRDNKTYYIINYDMFDFEKYISPRTLPNSIKRYM